MIVVNGRVCMIDDVDAVFGLFIIDDEQEDGSIILNISCVIKIKCCFSKEWFIIFGFV